MSMEVRLVCAYYHLMLIWSEQNCFLPTSQSDNSKWCSNMKLFTGKTNRKTCNGPEGDRTHNTEYCSIPSPFKSICSAQNEGFLKNSRWNILLKGNKAISIRHLCKAWKVPVRSSTNKGLCRRQISALPCSLAEEMKTTSWKRGGKVQLPEMHCEAKKKKKIKVTAHWVLNSLSEIKFHSFLKQTKYNQSRIISWICSLFLSISATLGKCQFPLSSYSMLCNIETVLH